jgi:hypothetical protein
MERKEGKRKKKKDEGTRKTLWADHSLTNPTYSQAYSWAKAKHAPYVDAVANYSGRERGEEGGGERKTSKKNGKEGRKRMSKGKRKPQWADYNVLTSLLLG